MSYHQESSKYGGYSTVSPQASLDAPRFRTSIPNESFIETIAQNHILNGLKSKGHNVSLAEPHPSFFGSGQIIETDLSNGTNNKPKTPAKKTNFLKIYLKDFYYENTFLHKIQYLLKISFSQNCFGNFQTRFLT